MVGKLKELTLSQFAIGDDRKLEAEEMFDKVEIKLYDYNLKIKELEFEIHNLKKIQEERIIQVK